MGKRASDFRGLAIPAAIAVALTMIYFVATNGWERLETPLPGVVAVIAGAIGFGAGAMLDRRRAARRPPPPQ